MSTISNVSAIVFDIGNVLVSWSTETRTSIPSRTLRRIFTTPTWFEYERGQLSQDDCYNRIASQLFLDPSELRRALEEARSSLKCNEKMFELIRELKAKSHGQLRIFAMSNISMPDYEFLRTQPLDWSIFDQVFTSSAVGHRKPELRFYKRIIAEMKIDPVSTIFIDDRPENVLAARSIGFHGILFDTTENVSRSLHNFIGDPTKRGQEFLSRNAGALDSVTSTGAVLKENFGQLLLLEATGDRNLVRLGEYTRHWNYFQSREAELLPADIDTTAVAFSVLKPKHELVFSVMDEILEYLSVDGIVQTYFDDHRLYVDPVACVNTLTLFYTYGRGSDLHLTLEWVHQVLLHRAYLHGTRYYRTPESFLFFLTRLLKCSDDTKLHQLMDGLLKERVQELVGGDGDALALAMRIITCAYVGIADDIDLRNLLPLQCEDGSWEMGCVCRFGKRGTAIGNRGLTTALAINAIEAVNRIKGVLPCHHSQPEAEDSLPSDSIPETNAPPLSNPKSQSHIVDHCGYDHLPHRDSRSHLVSCAIRPTAVNRSLSPTFRKPCHPRRMSEASLLGIGKGSTPMLL